MGKAQSRPFGRSQLIFQTAKYVVSDMQHPHWTFPFSPEKGEGSDLICLLRELPSL